jgi:nucleoside recognition membrane protein YjiH
VSTEKKPRTKELTDREKEKNRKMSKIRVKVEHALSGVKRSRIVKDILRNTKDNFSDMVMVIACGLHNLRVDHRRKPLIL